MRTFKDSLGDDWIIDLNVATIRRVLALLKIDLTLPQTKVEVHGTLSQQLAVDVWLLADVVCAICRPAMEAMIPPLTDEQFAVRLGSGALGQAKAILFEEWNDFFLSLGRPDMAAAVKKTLAMIQSVGQTGANEMDLLETQFLTGATAAIKEEGARALKQAMETVSGDSSTNSPRSRAATRKD